MMPKSNKILISSNFDKIWQILANHFSKIENKNEIGERSRSAFHVFWIGCQTVQRSVLCRSRRELSHENLLATFRLRYSRVPSVFDDSSGIPANPPAENGPSKVWMYEVRDRPNVVYR